MKTRLLTLLMVAISYTSFAEQKISFEGSSATFPNPNVFISNWTEVKDWKAGTIQGKQCYYTEQTIPAKNVTANSVVLTFAKMKGYHSSYKMFNKPMTLPFYFLSEENRGADVYYWFDANTPGTLKIGYQTDVSGGNNEAKMEFRYFVLPIAFLESHQLDETAVKHFSYQQLVQLLNITE